MFGLFDSLFGGSGKGPFDDMESEEATAFFVNVIDGDEDEDFYDDDDDEDDLFFDQDEADENGRVCNFALSMRDSRQKEK